MLLRRLDDYQSWQVVVDGGGVLIDPWLTPEAITGSFDRQHTDGFSTAEDARTAADGSPIDIIGVLLCTGVNDHARPETLMQLPDVPIMGPRTAARAASAAGARVVVPTATDPARDMSAWQRALYRVSNAGAADLAARSHALHAGEWLPVR